MFEVRAVTGDVINISSEAHEDTVNISSEAEEDMSNLLNQPETGGLTFL